MDNRPPLERVKAAAGRLKVFPLPSVALLPGSVLPLHIFEERYRLMVEAAVSTDGVFAMAHVSPGQEPLLSGAPQLEPMLCVGVIAMHEGLEDGRHNLVLAGVSRARILSEHPRTGPWREVVAEVLEDPTLPGEADLALRQGLLELIARVPPTVGERLVQLSSRARGGALADVVGGVVMTDVAERLDLLNEVDAQRRLRDVTDTVLAIVARLKPLKPEGPLN